MTSEASSEARKPIGSRQMLRLKTGLNHKGAPPLKILMVHLFLGTKGRSHCPPHSSVWRCIQGPPRRSVAVGGHAVDNEARRRGPSALGSPNYAQ